MQGILSYYLICLEMGRFTWSLAWLTTSSTNSSQREDSLDLPIGSSKVMLKEMHTLSSMKESVIQYHASLTSTITRMYAQQSRAYNEDVLQAIPSHSGQSYRGMHSIEAFLLRRHATHHSLHCVTHSLGDRYFIYPPIKIVPFKPFG